MNFVVENEVVVFGVDVDGGFFVEKDEGEVVVVLLLEMVSI